MNIELTEDIIQTINRRQRLMESLENGKSRVTLSLIEAENQKLARVFVEAYRKQVEKVL